MQGNGQGAAISSNLVVDGTLSASNLTNTNSGDVTIGGQASGLSRSGQIISLAPTGWTEADETWTRVSNSTFTCSTDQTVRYKKGTLIKWTQTTVKYGVVAIDSTFGAGVTTVTIIVNTDYVLTAAAISLNFYTYSPNPLGWPGIFNRAPTLVGFSADPTNTVYQYSVFGNLITEWFRQQANGTSNATTFTISSAVTAKTITNMTWYGSGGVAVDNGTLLTTPILISIASGGTVITLNKDMSAAAWTNANGKRANGSITYQF